jgi:hypothetical protein
MAYLRRWVAGFPPRLPEFESKFNPWSSHVGYVVDKGALGQVFSEYFGFPCKVSFHWLLHIHRHLSSSAGTIGQNVAYVQNELSLAPPQKN